MGKLNTYLMDEGIRHETTVRDTPQQNGIVERANLTIANGVRTNLLQANQPPSMWGEAAQAVCRTRNMLPRESLNWLSPFEVRYGHAPDLSTLHPWGCRAHVYKYWRKGKFEERAVSGVLMGYAERKKAYRIKLDDDRVILARDVKFSDDVFPGQASGNEVEETPSIPTEFMVDANLEGDIPKAQAHETTVADKTTVADNVVELKADERTPEAPSDLDKEVIADQVSAGRALTTEASGGNVTVTKSPAEVNHKKAFKRVDGIEMDIANYWPENAISNTKRERKPNRHIFNEQFQVHTESESVMTIVDDETMGEKEVEAMSIEEMEKWRVAITKELTAISACLENSDEARERRGQEHKGEHNAEGAQNQGDYDRVRNVVKSKLILKMKYYPNLKRSLEKARFVLLGFSQRPGIDFTHTYSPVINYSSWRLLMLLSIVMKWPVVQLDIPTAYLNADLDEKVFMRIPNYWQNFVDDGHKPGDVVLVRKAIYGLKQSGRMWYCHMGDFLTRNGFQQSVHEPCMYMKRGQKGDVIVMVYVDDIFVSGGDKLGCETFVKMLGDEYKAKLIGKVQSAIGMEVEWSNDDRVMEARQSKLIASAWECAQGFGGNTRRMYYTPITADIVKGIKEGKLLNKKQHRLYRTVVGKLQYGACNTRPDLSFAVGILGRSSQQPTENAMKAAVRVAKYAWDTKQVGVKFEVWDKQNLDERIVIHLFVDASLADDEETARSTGGFIVSIFHNGVSWKSNRSNGVCGSTVSSELAFMVRGTHNALLIRDIMIDVLKLKYKPVIQVYCDNEPLVRSLGDGRTADRTRHYRIQFYYMKERIEEGDVVVNKIQGEQNPADVFTKPLVRDKFEKYRGFMCKV